MSRYIDADALIEKLPKEYLGSTVHSMINEAPTIEPKRGKWIVSYTGGIKQTECSACGESFTTYDVYGWTYCPWCGARMKGADDE